MSERRALVDCTVLSLQDSCLFYPSCKSCFSRIDVERKDTARCSCSRCGRLCPREEVEYRYRLSLRVNRGTSIFGVSVFGNSLQPFFGINATRLQRLVENPDDPVEPSVRFRLLQKAVKDCFIGRHFIFGIKLTEAKHGFWTEGPASSGFSSKDFVQFIASQMILPKAAGLEGCTVVSYYQALLQKLSGYSQGPADPNRSYRIPESPLVLNTRPSLTGDLNNASGLLSQTLQRDHDCILTPTSPWQQSLGVITSSAEQDEGESTQDSGHKNSGWLEPYTTPYHVQKDCLLKSQVSDERPLLSPVELSFYSVPSLPKNSAIQHFLGNSPILNTQFASSSAKEIEISAEHYTGTLSSSLVALENLPLSESLSEFICGGNKELNIVRKEGSKLNAQCQEGKIIKKLESTTELTGDENVLSTEKHSEILQDATNTSAEGETIQVLSKQSRKDCSVPENKSQVRNINPQEGNEEVEEILYLEKEEEHLEGDSYNCSADLFSNSLITSMNTETLNNTHIEATRTTTESCSKLNQHHVMNENILHLTPDKPKRKKSKLKDRNSLTLQDFVPPSQSTPIVKVRRPPTSRYRNSTDEFSSRDFPGRASEVDSNKPADRECPKENFIWRRTSHRYRPWNGDEHKHPNAGKPLRVKRRTGNLTSMQPISQNSDSRVCEVTVSDNDTSEIFVPPTPARKIQMCVVSKQTNQNLSSYNQKFEMEQESIEKTQLYPNVTSSHKTDRCDIGSSDDKLNESKEPQLDESLRDWSRDLFSDSI